MINKVIGITGGIGSGKSTVCEHLVKRGFKHIDADKIGREVTDNNPKVLKELNSIFGPKGEYGNPDIKIINEDKTLDRKALASIVFSDEKKKKALDNIMLKEIINIIDKKIENEKSRYDNLIDKKRDSNRINYILLDAPLLFEAGLETKCDTVVLVVANMDIRVKRVCQRDGVLPQEVKARIQNQMSDKEKISKANYIIDNSFGIEELNKAINELVDKIHF